MWPMSRCHGNAHIRSTAECFGMRIHMPAAITGSACVLQRMSHMRGDRNRNGPGWDPHPSWWRARYSRLSLVVAVAGLIVSASAWFAVSHRENQVAALELSFACKRPCAEFAVRHQLESPQGLRVARLVRGLRPRQPRAIQHIHQADHERSERHPRAVLDSAGNGRPALRTSAWRRSTACPGYRIKSVAPDGSTGTFAGEERILSRSSTPQRRAPIHRSYGLDLNDGGMRQRDAGTCTRYRRHCHQSDVYASERHRAPPRIFCCAAGVRSGPAAGDDRGTEEQSARLCDWRCSRPTC